METLNKGQFSLSSYGLKDLITLYDGEISYLDYHLGLIFNRLEQWNLLNDTLLIITSDHGESFNEHEVWTHGNSLYEEQIRVPLIFHYPKLIPVNRVDNEHIVQVVDIMPSILDILEIPIPQNIQGRSLLPIFNGQHDTEFNLAFAELRSDINWKGKNQRFGDGIKAVINKEWKYISYDNGREELYKLDVDPKEELNMAPDKREKVQEMKKILDLWSSSVSRQTDGTTGLIDSGRLEQLRSLGYLK
jgi:arylsulfatase A-like enzyme